MLSHPHLQAPAALQQQPPLESEHDIVYFPRTEPFQCLDQNRLKVLDNENALV